MVIPKSDKDRQEGKGNSQCPMEWEVKIIFNFVNEYKCKNFKTFRKEIY